MAFFVRFTNNVQADLERNYSFVGYMLDNTKEESMEEHAMLLGVDADDVEEYIKQDNVTSKWGYARQGLCGFGEYETIEEAKTALDEIGAYGAYKNGAIFEGEICNEQTQDDGITFKAVRVVDVF